MGLRSLINITDMHHVICMAIMIITVLKISSGSEGVLILPLPLAFRRLLIKFPILLGLLTLLCIASGCRYSRKFLKSKDLRRQPRLCLLL